MQINTREKIIIIIIIYVYKSNEFGPVRFGWQWRVSSVPISFNAAPIMFKNKGKAANIHAMSTNKMRQLVSYLDSIQSKLDLYKLDSNSSST